MKVGIGRCEKGRDTLGDNLQRHESMTEAASCALLGRRVAGSRRPPGTLRQEANSRGDLSMEE